MKTLARELGQTVRAALESWPRTGRLCVIITVSLAAAVILTHYHV